MSWSLVWLQLLSLQRKNHSSQPAKVPLLVQEGIQFRIQPHPPINRNSSTRSLLGKKTYWFTAKPADPQQADNVLVVESAEDLSLLEELLPFERTWILQDLYGNCSSWLPSLRKSRKEKSSFSAKLIANIGRWSWKKKSHFLYVWAFTPGLPNQSLCPVCVRMPLREHVRQLLTKLKLGIITCKSNTHWCPCWCHNLTKLSAETRNMRQMNTAVSYKTVFFFCYKVVALLCRKKSSETKKRDKGDHETSPPKTSKRFCRTQQFSKIYQNFRLAGSH